jgi:histidinol dehydrogenase
LIAARVAGIERVFKVGGPQAIAAMAIGTATIPKVDKIFGPGNRFVTAAKALVTLPPYGTGIDTLAGPSELLVIADTSASPSWIAADLIAQAEHGPDSQVVLVSESDDVIERVNKEITLQLAKTADTSEFKLFAINSLGMSFALQVGSLEQAIDFANRYAPERLHLACRDAERLATFIHHAGSVFLGDRSSVVFGDYASGTNHILPTGGVARYCGGVTVESYLKPVSFQSVSADGANRLVKAVSTLAHAEGLLGHARAVEARCEHD